MVKFLTRLKMTDSWDLISKQSKKFEVKYFNNLVLQANFNDLTFVISQNCRF